MPEESYPGSHADRMEFEGIPSDKTVRLTLQIQLLKMGSGDNVLMCACRQWCVITGA